MRKLLLSIFGLMLMGAFLNTNAQQLARIHGLSTKHELQKPAKSADVEQVYFEGFEGYDPTSATTAAALPTGWEVYRTSTLATAPTTVATTKRWTGNNAVSNPFGDAGGNEWQEYVKTGNGSMIIGYTAEDFTWAVSSSINLPDVTGIELEFWMWYTKDGSSGTYPTNFHAQIFADGAWHALGSWVGQANNNWASALKFNLDAYKGKAVKLAFVYEYTDGYQMAIDDILITKPAPAKFPVTFTVIDGKETYTNIKIKGAMTGWATVAMTQNPAHTWKVTLDVEPGTYEWGAIEDDGSQDGIWLIQGPNKSVTVAADGTVTGDITYTIPAPQGKFPVTFTVIDQKEIYTNIKIKGTMTGWATEAMTQDPAHTWKVTLEVEVGDHKWGAVEDDGSEWGIWLIEGPDREFSVAADGTITGQTDYTILAPGDIPVTFKVNIKPLIDAGDFNPDNDYIDVAGSFNGWGGEPAVMDVDENDANIYIFETDATFRNAQELRFKFRKNGNWDLAETPVDPDGKMNRVFVVTKDIDNIYNAVWGENYTKNIGEVVAIADINVAVGATVQSLNLPQTVTVKLGAPDNLTDATANLPVTWATENFNSSQAGEITLTGTLGLEVEDLSKVVETRTVYFEGFEGYDPTSATTAAALPTGWEVYRTSALTTAPTTVATTKRWSGNNAVSNPFGDAGGNEWQEYVKTGNGSIIIGYTAEEFTWAVSSTIKLPDVDGINLEFWMWYTKTGSSGTYPTNFHLQVFADGSWHAVKSWVGEDNNNWASALTFSLDAYKGKDIKLGFVYEYTDGYQMAIDDIKITAPKKFIQYFNGHNLKAEVKVVVGTTNVLANKSFKFKMYPNPTTTTLNVTSVEQINSIRVINIIGQQVLQVSNVNSTDYEINTSELNNGVYIITVTGKNGASFSSRFIKK